MNVKMVKSLISVLVGLAASAGCFVLWIGALFSGAFAFYTALIVVSFVGIIGVLASWVASKYRILSVFLGAILASLICFAGKASFDGYDRKIPVIREFKPLLGDYAPFSPSSKIARLDSEASLRLSGDLPKIDGATALYPLYSSFVNATYPAGTYDPRDSVVLCGTTAKAYENLIDKKVDVIFCAEPSTDQTLSAESRGVRLSLTPIGYEAFVFFVNARNPVDNVSSGDIIGIYSGRIDNWKSLGGNNDRIKVFQRPKNSGSQTILEKIMGNETLMEPRKTEVIDGMGGIIEQTADYKNYKNAIGYSFLYYSTQMVRNGAVKLLSIDGVAPSREAIGAKEYPFTSNFYAVTREDVSANTRKLIDWVVSAEGQALVGKTGYVPLK